MFGLRKLRAVRQERTQDVAMLGVMVPMNQTLGIPTLLCLPSVELHTARVYAITILRVSGLTLKGIPRYRNNFRNRCKGVIQGASG